MSNRINKHILQFIQAQTSPSFHCVDMHTCGEPLRIILSGFPNSLGMSVLEYRNHLKSNYDNLRKLLMWEPRGHADMYGCVIIPINEEDIDFGVVFLHNEGYSTMCGHAIIALATLAAESNLVERKDDISHIRIMTPAGIVDAYASWKDDRVDTAYFDNVPSFVAELDQEVEVKGIGTVRYDLAYGGAFYAYLDAEAIGLPLLASNASQIIDWGKKIKEAVRSSSSKIIHPFESDLSFLYGTIFIGPAEGSADDRNVCVFADGEVDRSPTGTGVSGRMAIHHARNQVEIGEWRTIESIIGMPFRGQVKKITTFGPYQAIVPRVEGNAYVTGQHSFFLDPNDPIQEGFFLR